MFGSVDIKASAAVIMSNEAVGFVPTSSGDGLRGSFYQRSVDNIDQARTAVLSFSPDVTFLSTSLDYPRGNTDVYVPNTSLQTYLADDIANVTSGSPNSFVVDQAIFTFKGFIAITSDMDTNTATPEIDVIFGLGSNDGGYVKIGSSIIAQHYGHRTYGFSNGTASFQSEGLYEFEVLYFQDGLTTGIELFSSITPGVLRTDSPNANLLGILPQSVLYTSVPADAIPEPSTAAISLAVLGFGLSRRCRSCT